MKVSIKVSESDKQKMMEDWRAARTSAAERIRVHGDQHPDGSDAEDEEVGADAANARTSSLPELLHLEKPQGDGWIEFEKPILYLYAGKGPYVSRDLMQFPVSHPDDGYIDVVIQERVSEPIFRLC